MVDIAQHPRLSRPVLPSVMLGREGWAQLGWRLSMVGADNLVYCLVNAICHFFSVSGILDVPGR